MKNRRDFLKTGSVAAAGVIAVGALEATARPVIQTSIDIQQRDAFPAATVYSHLGETLQFYEDLIRGRVSMVNFMSITDEEAFPVTAFMAKVADQLGDRLGRDVFIHSVTSDPQRDTPKALLEFAQRFGVRDGWRFVTSSPEETAALSTRLYRHPPARVATTKKVDVVFYGNGAAGVWGTFPVHIDPADAAERIGWLMPRERPAGLRRAGPRRLDEGAEVVSHNRDV